MLCSPVMINLTPFVPRTFLPEQLDLTDTAALAPFFQKLEERLDNLNSIAEIEAWLIDSGELSAAMAESQSKAYIAMTCQTDDPEREKAYLHFVEVVDPWVKPIHFRLAQKLVAHPLFAQLAADDYYTVYCRGLKNYVNIYREENVPRETELAKLSQTYQKISGSMTVSFDGEDKTLTQVGKVLQETDRSRRQAAWEAMNNRRLVEAEKLDQLFDQMLALRHQIALAAGFTDYRAYSFASYERFDYTPQDCLDFHETIERLMVPLCRQMQEERRQKLGLETLRPWDSSFSPRDGEVDPDQLPPLKPFQTSVELVEKGHAIFKRVDPRLGAYFNVLREHELVDLDNRKGKAPGAYQSSLSEARVPFIFMNAVGSHRDVETLVHEAGHAFHALAARTQKLMGYRHAPIEFCEVASMGMELLAAPHLAEFYSVEEARRARRDHLIHIIKFFPWMAIVDAFQHWVYTNPTNTAADRRKYWLTLMDRFGGIEDWSGFEEVRATFWHRQLHIFEIPFYYVEYGIAQLGALQLWVASRKDTALAVENYLKGLQLGGSRPLPELFEAAGLKFDFTAKTIEPLVKTIREVLAASVDAGPSI